MPWYDWAALFIAVPVTVFQIARGHKSGFGLPLFEAVCLVPACVAATWLSTWLANMTRMNTGVVLLVTVLVIAFVARVLARWLFALTGWSFHSYDAAYSILPGLVLGWAVAHMFLRVIIASQGPRGEVATHMATSPVAREVFQFRTWNALAGLFFAPKQGPAFE